MLRNAQSRSTGSNRRRWASLFAVIFITAFFAAFFGADARAQLADAGAQVEAVAETAGVGGSTDLIEIIGRIINVFLGLLGVILLILILYAGFLWMTAAGDAEKVERAKKYLKNAVIGLIIIVCAFAIVRFILGWLSGGGWGGPGDGGGLPPGGGFPPAAGSLGGGIIESHYPRRNQTDVARNTAIIVTFKQPMKISSLIADYNDGGTPEDPSDDTVTEGLNDAAVKVYRTDQGEEGALASDRVRVRFTEDRRTFVFRPVDLLGSASVNVGYTVALKPGLDGILFENGTPAFTGEFGDGYAWPFETGTFVDLTPPRVVSVFPRAGGGPYYRNAVVHVLFSEAVDPTAAAGVTSDGRGFDNVRLSAGEGDESQLPPIDGEWKISNQYRTIEFIPAEDCGSNSCGETMYCLPGGTGINALVQAATLDGAGPGAQFGAAGYDGIVDVAGNSLDGDADGQAEGKPLDNYSWRFTTLNEVNRDPPVIEMTYPSSDLDDVEGRSNTDPFDPVRARFDTIIQSSSFSTDNAVISDEHESGIYADTFWFTTGQDFLTADDSPVQSPEDIPVKSECFILHRTFATNTAYDPYLFSGIRNVYQNCFNPASSNECLGNPNCCLNRPWEEACQFD
jgi:hypothetical protein